MQGGRFGLAARGVVIGVAGGFVIVAALRFDPSEATGLGGALQTLLQSPFGSWILGAVALGLVAYGLLMLAVARYGSIAPGRAF
jgi:choline-glycine betaine transporter